MRSDRPIRHGAHRRQADPGAVSLARALSKLGASTRTGAEELIRSGRVRVNGTLLRDAQVRVDLGHDSITLDGKRLKPRQFRYVAFHKPAGIVTTHADERGRTTVFDVLGPVAGDLRTVGRLDKETTGLLLLTNDHRMADRLTDPAVGIPKQYRAVLSRALTEAEVGQLAGGVEIMISGVRYRTRPAVVKTTGTALDLTITEGKNRQVRKMIEALGISVLALTRRAVGSVDLGTLPSGRWRDLSEAEVRALKLSVGLQGAWV